MAHLLRVDHYWYKDIVEKCCCNQRFCVLTKVIKCALSLSHGNADNERSLSVNKKTSSKERTSLSIIALNGLRATEDGIRDMDGLSNVNVMILMMLGCLVINGEGDIMVW